MSEKQFYTDKSHITGKGLFVNKPFKTGETVGHIHGPTEVIRRFTDKLSRDTLNWIGVGRYTWINTDESVFRFINHSCGPNVAIVTKRKVIALEDIPADTEILMDYSLTEAEEGWRLDPCLCGEANCRGSIGPIMTLPTETFERFERYIPKNFREIYRVSA